MSSVFEHFLSNTPYHSYLRVILSNENQESGPLLGYKREYHSLIYMSKEIFFI